MGYNSTLFGRGLPGKTACRCLMLSLCLSACALPAAASNRNFDPLRPDDYKPDVPRQAVSRGPLDNYGGHGGCGYPYVPDRTGQTHFFTRFETEKNGVLTKVRSMPYGKDLYPVAYYEKDWDAANNEWTEVASKTYEWDSEGRLTFNSDQKFSFDAEGRVAVCEYIYPDYNIRTTYEYDETGHCIKRTADLVYAGGTVTPSDVQDITWTESDGVVTTETVSHYYNESTATWSTTGKLVEETFDEPAGGWTKNTVYTLGPDGKTFVIDSRSHETIKRIVPGMINGYVTSSREERRYGDKLCLINESSTNVTDLGNYTVRIETTGMRYEYRSDGSLYREEPVKHEYTLQAYEYLPGLWAQNILYTKEYKYDSGTNEMILSREINREYNAQNLMILYEDAEYFWDFVDRTRTVFYRDELGREYERVQNNGHNDEIHPFLRHRITYVGDSYAYNTFEYSYYDKEADDWRVPSELYEYEWDTSVDGDKCYCFGATPAGLSVMAYKPVSRKLTKTASDGTATVEIERYYFNTSEELGGVESVTADRSAAGPVTVYSLSGANLGVYGSLEEAAIPAGLYIARQGTVVSKVVRR